MKNTQRTTDGLAICVAIASLTLMSCETRSQRGALFGGAAGAGIGAIVADDSPGAGALIGGTIGAATGAVIGDRQDRRYGYPYTHDDGYSTHDPSYSRAAYGPDNRYVPLPQRHGYRHSRMIYHD